MIKNDISGQASAELILLLAGIIAIVLISLSMYKDYLINFTEEINNNEVNNLLNKIDKLNNIIK